MRMLVTLDTDIRLSFTPVHERRLHCSSVYLVTDLLRLTLTLEILPWWVSRDPASTSVGAHRHPVGKREWLRLETNCKIKKHLQPEIPLSVEKKIRRFTYDHSAEVKSICWDIRYFNCHLFLSYWTSIYNHSIQVPRRFVI